MQFSLKTRLNIWIASVMTLFIAAGFAWVHFGLISILQLKNADFLNRKATELLAAVKDDDQGGPEALEAEIRREAQTYATDGLMIILRKPGAMEVVPESAENRRIALKIAEFDHSLLSQPCEITLESRHFMALRMTVQESLQPGYPIDLLLSLNETRHIQSQFDRRAMIGSIAFLILTISGGNLFVNKALSSVAVSIQTARRLQPDQLTARLPLSGTGDEIDELALTINELLDRLAAYHSQMTRFTADASHELRSPLGAMRAMVEVALQKPRNEMEYCEVLASLGEQCDRLEHLVDGLLLLARADAGQILLNSEILNPCTIAKEVIDLFEPLAEEKSIELIFKNSGSSFISADPQRIRQLFINLIDNAIKYSVSGGKVEISINVIGEIMEIIVADTGIGIKPDQLALIFDRFYQADTARSSIGSGLGLSICRWICHAHGGTIIAMPNTPAGTNLIIQLPIAK